MTHFSFDRGHRPTAASPAINCQTCTVRDRAICAALEPAELERLNSIVVEVNLDPGQAVFYERDSADFTFNVTVGLVRMSKMLSDGRRQITGFLFPGDFLGFSFRDVYAYTAEAVTRVRLCRFPRRQLTTLFHEIPKLEQRMLSVASNEIEAAQDQMLLLGRKHARERLASLLLMLDERARKRGEPSQYLELPMNRTDIADFLGLTIETVSRQITRLRKAGIVELEQNRLLVVPDMGRLRAACEVDRDSA